MIKCGGACMLWRGCEPDAEAYKCEECYEKAVYGPHWWLMTGKVT